MMNDIAISRLRTILNVSGPISTVGIRKKKPAFACWVTFFIFHLIHWSYVETVTFLLFFFDSHFSTKEQDACSCSLVPRNWASQAEETILQMFISVVPKKEVSLYPISYQGNSEVLPFFSLDLLAFTISRVNSLKGLFWEIQLLTCCR